MAWLPIAEQSDAATLSTLKEHHVQNPLNNPAFVAKEGLQVLSGDARIMEDDSLEIFLGTTGGQTLSLHADINRISVRTELRQASSGFSLFRSPAKSVGSGQRVCDVCCIPESDFLLTISEDGKVKQWQISSGNAKCVVERILKMDGLYACRATVMQDSDIVVLVLKAEASPDTCLIWSSLRRLSDFRPEQNKIDFEGLKNAGVFNLPSDTFQQLTGLSAVSLAAEEGGVTKEVLCSVWQSGDASVVCLSTLEKADNDKDEWSTDAMYSCAWELQSQLELAELYLEKWDLEVAVDEELGVVMPHASNHFEELVLGPRRFPGEVLVLGLSQMLQDYGRQPPQEQPLLLASGEGAVRQHVQDKMSEFFEAKCMSAREQAGAWCDLFARCLQLWRVEHDTCIGIAEVAGCCFSDILLVKKRGLSFLRTPSAGSTEDQFHKAMSSAGGDVDDEGEEEVDMLVDADTAALWLGHRMLQWAEAADPGGLVFSRMLMEDVPVDAVQRMVQRVLQQSADQHPACDPEYLLGRCPELLDLGGSGDTAASPLCQSLQRQLQSLQGFHANPNQAVQLLDRGSSPKHWLACVLERACEQLVACHFEVVRSLALLVSLLDAHRIATGLQPSSAGLHAFLTTSVAPLLVGYHTLRWSGTRRLLSEGEEPEQTLLTYCVVSAAYMGDAEQEALSPTMLPYVVEPHQSSLALRIFKDLHDAMQSGATDGGNQWEDLHVLASMQLARHQSIQIDAGADAPQLVDKSVLALMQGLCSLHMGQWEDARGCFEKLLGGVRASLPQLESLLKETLGLGEDTCMSAVQTTFDSVPRQSSEVTEAIKTFFLLHDKRGGVFEVIRQAMAAVPAGGAGGECACEVVRLAMTSLEDIQARVDSLLLEHGAGWEGRKLRALEYLVATAHDTTRLNLSQACLQLSRFEEAYAVIAGRIKACGDKDIEKLEQLDDQLRRSRRDETEDVMLWLARDDDDPAPLQGMLAARRQQSAYRCLRMFIDAPTFRRRLDKLSAFPWVGCGNTVDSLLRQLNDVGGRSSVPDKDQAEIDASYHARYVFNIARSDYRAAAETMVMHCYNQIAANLTRGDHVPVEALRRQADSCVVAINAYSLLDPRFAFWTPPAASGMPALLRRARSDGSGKRAMSPSSSGAPDATTMGWKVTKAAGSTSAPDSMLRSSMTDASGGEDAMSDVVAALPEGFVTMPMLCQHYALLRARIRLAEAQAERRGLRELPLQRIISLAAEQQRAVAEESVEELIDFGLLDDAVTVAVQFALDEEELVRQLTRRCLRGASEAAEGEGSPVLDEQGVEADPWKLLQGYLARMDGTKRVVGEEDGVEGGKQVGRRVGSHVFGRLHRVAGETILTWTGADVPLPPWLKKAMRCGVEGSTERVRFDTKGADACGLLRLYLRYDLLEEAAQLVCECLELDAADASPEEYAQMDLSAMRYVPYQLLDQLTHRLERKATHGGAAMTNKERAEVQECQRAVEGALKRWMGFTGRESQLVKELCMTRTVADKVDATLQAAEDPLQVAAVDVVLLVNRVCSSVKDTPAGKGLLRAVGGEGATFTGLCVQMLQRRHPNHPALPRGKRWAEML